MGKLHCWLERWCSPTSAHPDKECCGNGSWHMLYRSMKNFGRMLTHLPLEVSGIPDLPQELTKALNQDGFAGSVV